MQKARVTGEQIKHARIAAGLSQGGLAERAGLSRQTVNKAEKEPCGGWYAYSVRRIAEALGLDLSTKGTSNARAPVRGITDAIRADEERRFRELAAKEAAAAEKMKAKARVRCGARTRKGGACKHMSEPGRRRCKFHGGMSTGAKTAEGRARIAEAQRRRWERFRAEEVAV